MRDIQAHQNGNWDYIDEGIQLLRLAQRAHLLFETQPPAEERKLLNFVVSNCTCKNGQMKTEDRRPF